MGQKLKHSQKQNSNSEQSLWQPLRFVPPRRAQLFCPAHSPPEQRSYAAVGAPLCMLRAIHSPSAVCSQQATTYSCKDSAALRAAVAPAPRARLYAVCRGTFQAVEAALRQQPAASAVSLVGSFICQKQGGDRGNCTSGQQSSSNRCDSSRCTVRRCFARVICPRNRRVVQR